MPCLNEERTIGICINEAKNFIKENNISAEILISDNGSTDNSIELAKELGAKVIKVSRRGYGAAVIAGIKKAEGKYIIMGDCDCSYDFYHIDDFIKYLNEGYEFVIGNRFKGKIESGAMPFTHKYLGVPFLSLIGRIRFKTNIGDFHCGIRGFSNERVNSLKFDSEGMEFATEMIGRFVDSGCKIKEIPVNLRKDKRGRKPHLRSVRDGLRHLKLIVFYKK